MLELFNRYLSVERWFHIMRELRGWDAVFLDRPLSCCGLPLWKLLLGRTRTSGHLLGGNILRGII